MKNRGFTVMELMVAVGLIGIAVLGTFNVLAYFRLQYNRTFLLTDARISSTLGERFIYMHVKSAHPSFNNLIVEDDNGNNFYDLNSEYPVSLVTDPQLKTRKLTLSSEGKTRTYMIVGESKMGPPVYVDPVRLFTAGRASTGAPGALTFVGFTNNNYITKLSRKMNPSHASRPLWREGGLLYIYTPATLRSDKVADGDFVSPYCFFGVVQGQNLMPQNFGGLVKCRNPVDDSDVTGLQDFMMRLPSQNGGIPVVLLQAISVLRYDLVPGAKAGHFDLVFSKWNGTDFSSPQFAATDVYKVVFERPSIADTTILVKVIPEDQKDQAEDE